jgi:polysaccharide pyruvyl transferase WcaK-like protein
VAIQYQYKTRGIMDMLGMGQWVLPIETAAEHNLPPLLLAAWNERMALRTHLQAVLPPLVEEVLAVGRAIQQDYAQWVTHPAPPTPKIT